MRGVAMVLVLLSACAPERISPAAEAYLLEAIDSLQAVALTRGAVDWADVRREALARAAGAGSPPETYPAIRYALSRLEDDHSFLQLSDSLAALEAERADAPEDGPADAAEEERSPSPFGTRMSPEFELLVREWGTVALVFMPQGRRSDEFAASFQQAVGRLADQEPCAWIVDVRGNGGGNMWPMLAGLGPVLGEGEVGGSVDADGARSRWAYRGGEATFRDPSGVERAFARVGEPLAPLEPAPPVAVLHDRGTASSGEAMAVAFRGRAETRSFGERTYGASTSTRGVRLSDGANMVVATDVFVDREGTRYPRGLEPDVPVPGPDDRPRPGSDPVVEAALEWLAGTEACRAG